MGSLIDVLNTIKMTSRLFSMVSFLEMGELKYFEQIAGQVSGAKGCRVPAAVRVSGFIVHM